MRFKGYDLQQASHVEDRLHLLLSQSSLRISDDDGQPRVVEGATYGLPRLVTPRAGQGAFKSLILTSYHRRCAITGNKVSPVLQAAHIRPVSREGLHRVDNGMLLRSDVHILFDKGYLGVDEKHRLQVSRRLGADFGNGREFYERAGQVIDLPDRRADRPSAEAVAWHMDECFLR